MSSVISKDELQANYESVLLYEIKMVIINIIIR